MINQTNPKSTLASFYAQPTDMQRLIRLLATLLEHQTLLMAKLETAEYEYPFAAILLAPDALPEHMGYTVDMWLDLLEHDCKSILELLALKLSDGSARRARDRNVEITERDVRWDLAGLDGEIAAAEGFRFAEVVVRARRERDDVLRGSVRAVEQLEGEELEERPRGRALKRRGSVEANQ